MYLNRKYEGLKMKKQKTYEEICNEFSDFRLRFYDLMNLVKLFSYTYENYMEIGEYPDDNSLLAKNCLNSLNNIIRKLITGREKEIEYLFHNFSISNDCENFFS